MEESKKRKILLVVAIITVLLTVIGATYAYFTAQEGKATTKDVQATTGTTDSLTFETEGELEINASILNFKEGEKSLRDDAKAIATLKAGTESEPNMNYYVYLQIDKNEFTYTTEAKKPELLLKVKSPEGYVESIPGLGNAITVTIDGKEESGFDITEQKKLIKIAEEYGITTTTEKIDEWIIEIVYINLDSNQNDHLNKNLNATIKIQAEPYQKPKVTNIGTEVKALSIKADVTATAKEGEIVAYYYCLDDGECERSTASTYTFKGMKPLTKYNVRIYVEDSNGEISEEFSKPVTTLKASTISDVCEDGEELSNCLISLYTTDGTNGLYYHDGVGTYTNANLEAEDNSYRYAGASVNNYVCFGSTEKTCPEDNLYRIIGVFPTDETLDNYEVKLIKSTTIGSNYWSGAYGVKKNTWVDSRLRTEVLNSTTGNYWKSLGTDIIKITNNYWIVSGGTKANLGTQNAKTVYNYEVAKTCSACTNKETWSTLRNYIGLMYVSDYMYAASPSYWNTSGANYACSYDWLCLADYSGEWTISRASDTKYNILMMTQAGAIGNAHVVGQGREIRPTMYLNSDVEYASGTGTSSNPIRIN